MPGKNVTILDGSGAGDKDLSPILDVLSCVFKAAEAEVVTFSLREMKLAHCLGCFGCWVKTPGLCVEADAGRDIARAIVRSDVTVLFTPVTFGGYSPELKKMVDRFIQLASPFFQMDHGEVHHPPRYSQRPRMVMVGAQRHPNPTEAHIFKTLAGRNAINFHPPSYAADVVSASENMDALQRRFEALLTRSDALPIGDAAASLMPPPVMSCATVEGTTVAPPISLQRGERAGWIVLAHQETQLQIGDGYDHPVVAKRVLYAGIVFREWKEDGGLPFGYPYPKIWQSSAWKEIGVPHSFGGPIAALGIKRDAFSRIEFFAPHPGIVIASSLDLAPSERGFMFVDSVGSPAVVCINWQRKLIGEEHLADIEPTEFGM